MFLSTSEASRLTGIPRRTLSWAAKHGKIRAELDGRDYRLDFRSLLHYVTGFPHKTGKKMDNRQ